MYLELDFGLIAVFVHLIAVCSEVISPSFR